ncbi:unnamed protein product [Adineta ricciae]|uniref:Uncharacterized protein n=1 Tax=Adineta ricciae TaxID=249248 RepID=A0A816HEZ6_ADIRI|nr:unnamed protein product [Adineta ricciae]
MFIAVSFINLALLLTVSICQVVLSIVYHDECPSSPFLSTTLGITGAVGVILSILAAIIHRYDAYDGTNRWNLYVTCLLLVYLIGSRVVVSIFAFRLASRRLDEIQCAAVLYWCSTFLIIISYSIIIITSCLLVKLVLLQRRDNFYHKPTDTKPSSLLEV